MTDYTLIASQLDALLDGETDALANAANTAALLYNTLDDVNWVGFYVLRDDELVLGPFQGNTACVRIGMGKGVCGTAAQTRTTQRIADVHAFDGHIACDAASLSEIVIPLVRDGRLYGVLDIDSPVLDRFSADDQAGLEAVCERFTNRLDDAWL